jgi:hypothetical protein
MVRTTHTARKSLLARSFYGLTYCLPKVPSKMKHHFSCKHAPWRGRSYRSKIRKLEASITKHDLIISAAKDSSLSWMSQYGNALGALRQTESDIVELQHTLACNESKSNAQAYAMHELIRENNKLHTERGMLVKDLAALNDRNMRLDYALKHTAWMTGHAPSPEEQHKIEMAAADASYIASLPSPPPMPESPDLADHTSSPNLEK